MTIENSAEMYAIAKRNLLGIANITMLQGDTRQHLPDIVAQNDNLIYWLDAHWSGGLTYGESDECPILDELAIIPPSVQEGYRDFMQCQVSTTQNEANTAMPNFLKRLRQKVTGRRILCRQRVDKTPFS